MKTRQANMRAKFTTEQSNAKNMNNEKELCDRFLVIDKRSERTVVDCRVYMGKSSSASTVYASIWVSLAEGKKPEGWTYGYTSGRGQAGGYGYHKISAAVADAIQSAGIKLCGSDYLHHDEKPDFKKHAAIGGVGESATKSALLAIAYAAGFTDCILV